MFASSSVWNPSREAHVEQVITHHAMDSPPSEVVVESCGGSVGDLQPEDALDRFAHERVEHRLARFPDFRSRALRLSAVNREMPLHPARGPLGVDFPDLSLAPLC